MSKWGTGIECLASLDYRVSVNYLASLGGLANRFCGFCHEE